MNSNGSEKHSFPRVKIGLFPYSFSSRFSWWKSIKWGKEGEETVLATISALSLAKRIKWSSITRTLGFVYLRVGWLVRSIWTRSHLVGFSVVRANFLTLVSSSCPIYAHYLVVWQAVSLIFLFQKSLLSTMVRVAIVLGPFATLFSAIIVCV